jgi:hypothetical protein
VPRISSGSAKRPERRRDVAGDFRDRSLAALLVANQVRLGETRAESRIARAGVSRTMIETIPLSLEATSSAPSAQRPVP